MIISVFRTSIEERDILNLSPELNKLNGISDWNTDLEDCDRILRVVSQDDMALEIISILSKQGFLCEELED